MESKAKFLGHPIHQMLIVLPLGVLAMSLVFDLIARFANMPNLHEAAYYMIAAGVISGLVAAVFGAIDFFAIPGGTRAKRIGPGRASPDFWATVAPPQSSWPWSSPCCSSPRS